MAASIVLNTYVLFFLLISVLDLLIDFINILHINKNKNDINPVLAEKIDLKTHIKSTEYTIEKLNLGIFEKIVGILFLLIVFYTGFFGYLEAFIDSYFSFADHPYLYGFIFFILFNCISSILSIPFSLYKTFQIEQKYGFNQMTYKLWFFDLVKSLILGLIISAPIIIGIFYFFDKFPNSWWLISFIFIVSVQLILLYIYPIFIAPLFNKFQEIEEGELKTELFKLSQLLNFKTSGIFKMDGSKRSKHSNAYFTGFGKNKRIVLFDTLIEQLEVKELVAVLAHEIGHQKLKHIVKMMAMSLLILLMSLIGIHLLTKFPIFYESFGFTRESSYAAIIIFMFLSSPFSFFISPLSSMLSRKHEFEADNYAIKSVGNTQDLINALLVLTKDNLSSIIPHKMYSFIHYSHPTINERIMAMKNNG